MKNFKAKGSMGPEQARLMNQRASIVKPQEVEKAVDLSSDESI